MSDQKQNKPASQKSQPRKVPKKFAAAPVDLKELDGLIVKHSRANGLDPNLVKAIVFQESIITHNKTVTSNTNAIRWEPGFYNTSIAGKKGIIAKQEKWIEEENKRKQDPKKKRKTNRKLAWWQTKTPFSQEEKEDLATSWGSMQVMGATARDLGFKGKFEELQKPDVGIEYGCKKLRASFNYFTRKYPQTNKERLTDYAIAAYNTGEGNVKPKNEPHPFTDKGLKYLTEVKERLGNITKGASPVLNRDPQKGPSKAKSKSVGSSNSEAIGKLSGDRHGVSKQVKPPTHANRAKVNNSVNVSVKDERVTQKAKKNQDGSSLRRGSYFDEWTGYGLGITA